MTRTSIPTSAGLAALLVLSFLLRMYHIGAPSLWLDEAMSASFLDFPLPEIIARNADPRSVHPPLYFVLLKLWSGAFGDSETSLRSLAAAVGTASVALLFLVIRSASAALRWRQNPPASIAWLSAALLAVNPLHIELSKQVRGYTVALALWLAALWLALRALRAQSHCLLLWVCAALFLVAFCYTHELAVLSVAPCAILFSVLSFAPGANRRRRLIGLLLAALTFVALYVVPWVPHLLAHAQTIKSDIDIPTTSQKVSDTLVQVLLGTSAPHPYSEAVVWACCGVLLVAFSAACAASRSTFGWLLLSAGLAPAVLNLCFSAISNRTIFEARYLFFAQPFWIAAIAHAALHPILGFLRPAAFCGLLLTAGASLAYQDFGAPTARPGMRCAAEFVRQRFAPADLVVASSAPEYFIVKYYCRDFARVFILTSARHRDELFGTEHLADDVLLGSPVAFSERRRNVWLFGNTSEERSAFSIRSAPQGWFMAERITFQRDRPWFEQAVLIQRFARD